MITIQSTVWPTEQLSETEWLKEFRVGILAPKSTEGRDRAKEIMNSWKDKNDNIDFSKTIGRLKV